MWRLLEDGVGSIHVPVDMLVLLREDFYLERCRERLAQGLFRSEDLQPLLRYRQAFKPADYTQVLIELSRLIRDRSECRSPILEGVLRNGRRVRAEVGLDEDLPA